MSLSHLFRVSPLEPLAKILLRDDDYSKRQFMLEIAFAIFPNRTRIFYQEISFSAFNNFHIIQFYFQFPFLLVKNYGDVGGLCSGWLVVYSSRSAVRRGLLKCHRILRDIYSKAR